MKLCKRNVAPFLVTTCAVMILQTVIAFADEPKPSEPKTETTTAGKQAVPEKSPSDVLVKVNGTPITRAELDRATSILIAQNRSQQPMDAATKKLVENAALDRLIDLEVSYQTGRKLDIKDLDKMIADKAAQGKARFPTAAEYEAALKANNISEKEITELIRKDIVIGNLFEKEVITKIVVPDADVKKFYDENQDKFKQPESFHASHILIGIKPEDSPEVKQKAREKAETIRKKIVGGADFAELAKTESSCPSSKQGGDLGFFSKGEMVPPFENAVSALKPGEISGVVETQFGFHIIKLVEKKDGGIVTFDEAKDNIKNYLKQQKAQKAVTEYVATLKSSAKIEKLQN